MEYTKGEWEAKGSRVVIPKKDGFIPTIYFPTFVVAQCSTYCGPDYKEPDYKEAEANAQLISATPDMYEALKDAQYWFAEAEAYIPLHSATLSAINKALAKAEDKEE